MEALKAEQLGKNKWRVLAIPFGGPFKGGKDLDGEYFSPRTDIKADWFPERPVLWHHGQDSTLKDTVLGIEGELIKGSDGWWAELWLDRGTRYVAQIEAMLAAGKAYGSSGSLSHLVRKARDGEILVWPHIEQTLSTIPINILSRVVPAKALLGFDSAGIAVDDAYKAVLADPSATDLRPDLSEPAAAATDGDDVAMKREKAIDRIGRLVMATRTIRY